MKNRMKSKDYIYLARESVKSRKKSTKTTVRGIAFGLVLILPVLFFSLAYYLDFTSEINKQKSVYCFSLNTFNVIQNEKDTVSTMNWSVVFNYDIIDELSQTGQVTEKIVSEFFQLGYGYFHDDEIGTDIKIGEDEFQRLRVANNNQTELLFNKIRVLHYDSSAGKLYPDSAQKDFQKKYDGNIIMQGDTFSSQTKGAKEIIISERLVDFLGYTVQEIIGEPLTLKNKYYANKYSDGFVDNDNNPNNDIITTNDNTIYEFLLCEDFTIVGVISKDYYKLNNMGYDTDIIITDASVYTDSEYNSYKPAVNRIKTSINERENDYYTVYTYPVNNIINHANTCISSEKFFPAYGYGLMPISALNYDHTESTMKVLLQFKNYNGATMCDKLINNRLDKLKTGDVSYVQSNHSNSLFSSLSLINKISAIVILVFLIFGGVVLLATLINLFNTIQYSVESRRNYMGMLRAIGAKNFCIKNLYFTEVIIIFLKAIIRTVIIGGVLCVLVKIGFDYGFAYVKDIFGINLSLNLIYLPIVIGIIIIFAILIALLYAMVCCLPLCNKPILKVLKEDL